MPGDPQMQSSPGASAAVMKLLLEALVLAGKLGSLELVLEVMRALSEAANASSRADREEFVEARGQLLLQVTAVYLRESSGPGQGAYLKQPRQLKGLQHGNNEYLPEFLGEYTAMMNWLMRVGDGEEAYKKLGESWAGTSFKLFGATMATAMTPLNSLGHLVT